MGKILSSRSAGPNDPIFSGGVEIFSLRTWGPDPKREANPQQSVAPNNKVGKTQRRSRPQKTKQVDGYELTVNWGGDIFTLFLTDDDWASVQSGKRRRCEVEEERFQMDIHWHFNSDPDYNLILDYGDPNHLRWLGQISQAQIAHQQITMFIK